MVGGKSDQVVSGEEWRCRGCDTLLGKISPNGEIEIQYKGAQYRVSRPVTAKCRRCGATITK